MKGQYFGAADGDVIGTITVEFDEFEDMLTGSATLMPNDPGLPATWAKFPIMQKGDELEFDCSIFAVRRDGNLVANEDEFQRLYPGATHGKRASIKVRFQSDDIVCEYETDIDTSGGGVLHGSKADSASEISVVESVTDWQSFKIYVDTLSVDNVVFRGQPKPYKLRTSFHRTNRKDLARYIDQDLTSMSRYFEDQFGFSFRNSDDFGTFANWLQHHGYPTPLLDWTTSPWVAAFFAFRSPAADDTKVRIFAFDKQAWCRDLAQFAQVSRVPPHFSFLSLGTRKNSRVGPQKAVTFLTNIDDIESYIAFCEQSKNRRYLYAVDLPASERPKVIYDLERMNVSPEILFPNTNEAVCEQFRNMHFHNRNGW